MNDETAAAETPPGLDALDNRIRSLQRLQGVYEQDMRRLASARLPIPQGLSMLAACNSERLAGLIEARDLITRHSPE